MTITTKVIRGSVLALYIAALTVAPLIIKAQGIEYTAPFKQIQLPNMVDPMPLTLQTGVKPSNNTLDQSMWTYTSIINETACMALNLYFEARNQSVQGQLAVGLVTINRVRSEDYPNSICGVVWQNRKNSRGKLVAQFSWTLDGKIDRPLNPKSWADSLQLAETLLYDGNLSSVEDFTNGADHYHANYVDPSWNRYMTHTITIGDHIFYSTSPVVNLAQNKL